MCWICAVFWAVYLDDSRSAVGHICAMWQSYLLEWRIRSTPFPIILSQIAELKGFKTFQNMYVKTCIKSLEWDHVIALASTAYNFLSH